MAREEASTVVPRGRVPGVLGVDGGQSGIRLRHSLGDRVVEVEGVSRLEGDTVAVVADAVAEGWRRGGFHRADRVVLGLTSIRHATSSAARESERPRLHDIADVVLDNGGCVGDAAVDIEGLDRPVAPTSTVVGAAILNAVVAEAVQLLVDRAIVPDVHASSNTAGGDAANARFVHPATPR